jgi:hypothetical protein
VQGDPNGGAPSIQRADGRAAFGGDPAGYAAYRPDYPERVYEVLCDRCGLGAGTATFEIGPATGLVTGRLAALGAEPLVAIEPDARLADYLADALHNERALDLRRATFENVELEDGRFDLGVAATSFHCLEQREALRKVACALRPGGWWAMWWTVFGDPAVPDPFHDATVSFLERLGRNPSAGASGIWPFALEQDARLSDLGAEHLYDRIEVDLTRTTIVLSPEEVRGLYATFSTITMLSRDMRTRVLDELVRIATDEFGGRVERHLVTVLYTAQRTSVATPV